MEPFDQDDCTDGAFLAIGCAIAATFFAIALLLIAGAAAILRWAFS